MSVFQTIDFHSSQVLKCLEPSCCKTDLKIGTSLESVWYIKYELGTARRRGARFGQKLRIAGRCAQFRPFAHLHYVTYASVVLVPYHT